MNIIYCTTSNHESHGGLTVLSTIIIIIIDGEQFKDVMFGHNKYFRI